jgi:hypothetical protein
LGVVPEAAFFFDPEEDAMRPNIPKRTHQCHVKFRPTEYQRIAAEATRLQISVAEAVRGWVLGGLRTGAIPDGTCAPLPGPPAEV